MRGKRCRIPDHLCTSIDESVHLSFPVPNIPSSSECASFYAQKTLNIPSYPVRTHNYTAMCPSSQLRARWWSYGDTMFWVSKKQLTKTHLSFSLANWASRIAINQSFWIFLAFTSATPPSTHHSLSHVGRCPLRWGALCCTRFTTHPTPNCWSSRFHFTQGHHVSIVFVSTVITANMESLHLWQALCLPAFPQLYYYHLQFS